MMKYIQSHSNARKGSGKVTARSLMWIAAVVILIIVLIIIATRGRNEHRQEEKYMEELSEEINTIVADETNTVVEKIVSEDDAEDGLTRQEILLEPSTNDGNGTGVARRELNDTVFTHAVVAELPAIDTTTHFYEGWLVQPGVTTFFSTGEMFAREDGKWGLVWESTLEEAVDNVLAYRKVVITLEPRDGDPAPAPDHVIEGTFDEGL